VPDTNALKRGNAFRVNLWITFVGFLDTHLLIPIMALYAAGLGARVGLVGLIVGLYSIANVLANIIFGRVIDRLGPRRPLMLGLIGDAAAMFLYSLCRLPVHLILVRIFHGITGGVIGPATMTITAAGTADHRGGRVMACYGMALAAATLVGYLVSATLSSRLGYNFVFYFGALMLVSGVIAMRWLPRRPAVSPAPAQSFRVEVAQGMALLKRKGLRGAYGAVFAQYFAFGGLVTLLPLYLYGLGMTSFHVGMMMGAFAIVFIALQAPSGMLSDRRGRKLPAAVGLGLSIVALALLPTRQAFPALIAVMALYGASYALIFPSITAMVADATSVGERGRATGIFHALLTVGVAVGAPLMGRVAEAVGVGWGLALCASALVVALPLVLASPPPRSVPGSVGD